MAQPAQTGVDDPDAPQPAPDGHVRRDSRLTTILLVGRLMVGDTDHICRVRNVSPGGMMVECDAALDRGQRVRVELRNMNVVEGMIVWSSPPRAGIMFDAATDVTQLLQASAAAAGQRPRAPRLSAACAVLLWHEGLTTTRHLRDLSQSGCRLAMETPLPIGSEARISIPGLPPRHATLRWTAGGEAGFAFRDMLSFAELSTWQRDHDVRFGDNITP